MSKMMKKNVNSAARLAIAVVVALTLCFGMATPVFADGNPVNGTEANSAATGLTKILVMPEGTTPPVATFTFKIERTQITIGSNQTAAIADVPLQTTALLPGLTNLKPVAGNANAVQFDIKYTASSPTVSGGPGLDQAIIESGNLFPLGMFTTAGIYAYTITEQTSPPTFTNTNQEFVTKYSPAEYQVVVWVSHKAAPNQSQLYIEAIASTIKIKDTNDQNGGDKVDSRPGGTQTPGDYSKMIFTNHFYRDNGGGSTDPKASLLALSKTTEGDGADLTKHFEFSVKLTSPDISGIPTTFKAYLIEGNTVVQVIPDDNKGSASVAGSAPEYFVFNSGEAKTIKLKNNQRLSFISMPVGTEFEATETGTTGYVPSCDLTLNGAGPFNYFSGKGEALAIDHGTTNKTQIISEKGTAKPEMMEFTNTYGNYTAPTGIKVSDMPFVVLILALALGVTVYAVIRYRKSSKQSA